MLFLWVSHSLCVVHRRNIPCPYMAKSLLWAGSVLENGDLWLAESNMGGTHFWSWCSGETFVSRKCSRQSYFPAQRHSPVDSTIHQLQQRWVMMSLVLWFGLCAIKSLIKAFHRSCVWIWDTEERYLDVAGWRMLQLVELKLIQDHRS